MNITTILIVIKLSIVGILYADWVCIGYPGNEAQDFRFRYHNRHEGDGLGAVSYYFQIGKYAVTITDWMRFYSATRITNNGSMNSTFDYWNDGIRNLGDLAPAVNISFNDAARYCNWLSTGDPYEGAYTICEVGSVIAIDRNFRNSCGEVFVLPNEDEWVKAAYFKGEYPIYTLFAHGSDAKPPITEDGVKGWNYGHREGTLMATAWPVDHGGREQNGTHNMMGNVWEWIEDMDGMLRGGQFDSPDNGHLLRSSNPGRNILPSQSSRNWGFRVVRLKH
jgi:formylglycine-generating enzyme